MARAEVPLEENILRDLVVMPTETGNRAANNAVLEYIGNFAVDRDMHVQLRDYDGYGALVATTQDTMTPAVMLNGHGDVVPAPARMFKLTRRGDKLFGRGVFDMKGGIAGYLATTDALFKSGELHDLDYGISIVTDEETQDRGTPNLLRDGYLPKKGAVLFDGVQDWSLETGGKGAWTTILTAHGKSAHGAKPWEGDSATFKLLDLLGELRAHFVGQGPTTDTLNITLNAVVPQYPDKFQATGAINQIPHLGDAGLDIRVLSLASKAYLEGVLNDLCAKHGAEWQQTVYFLPREHDLDSSYSRMFQDSIREVTGMNSPPSEGTGANDAGHYLALGVPCVVTRPAGGGQHSENEWIDRRGLAQIAPVLGSFLRKAS